MIQSSDTLHHTMHTLHHTMHTLHHTTHTLQDYPAHNVKVTKYSYYVVTEGTSIIYLSQCTFPACLLAFTFLRASWSKKIAPKLF